MGNNLSTFYRDDLKRITKDLMDEVTGEEVNWHTVELKGQDLLVLSRAAIQEKVKERHSYIANKLKGG